MASTTANVTSTAGDATLTVSDASPTATGSPRQRHVQPPAGPAGARVQRDVRPGHVRGRRLLGRAADAAELGGPRRRTTSLALDFRQAIGANDALRTGAYAKTLTLTLSTTSP